MGHKKYSYEEAKALIDDFNISNLSCNEYCKIHQIPKSTFYDLKKKVENKSKNDVVILKPTYNDKSDIQLEVKIKKLQLTFHYQSKRQLIDIIEVLKNV